MPVFDTTRQVDKELHAHLTSSLESQKGIQARWKTSKEGSGQTQIVLENHGIPSQGRNLHKLQNTVVRIEHGLITRATFLYTKPFRNLIFEWDSAPPGEFLRWGTDHSSEIDPLPPGWSVEAPEIIVGEDRNGVLQRKLRYSCIKLEYKEESYGRTTDWTAAEKESPEYQALLSHVASRVATVRDSALLGPVHTPLLAPVDRPSVEDPAAPGAEPGR